MESEDLCYAFMVFFIIFELDRLSFYCNYMEKSGSGIYYIEIYIYAFNKSNLSERQRYS